MKAITIHRPWASLIAFGLKPIETRTHARFLRLVGKTIAIHAAKRWDRFAFSNSWPLTVGEMAQQAARDYGANEAALYAAMLAGGPAAGCVVAVVDVVAHRRLTQADSAAALCPADGLYGLILENVRRFREPIPATGRQGIWTWEPPTNWRELLK